MSVRVLDDHEVDMLVSFAAQNYLLAEPPAVTAARIRELSWQAFVDRYPDAPAQAPYLFSWAVPEPSEVFDVTSALRYNVPDIPFDLAALIKAVRKKAVEGLRLEGPQGSER